MTETGSGGSSESAVVRESLRASEAAGTRPAGVPLEAGTHRAAATAPPRELSGPAEVSAGRDSAGARFVHEGILRRQSARESAARTYARALPIVPVRARGLTIEGADGRRYLDCLSGAGTLALGHNHPVVLEAIRKVLDSGAPLNVLDLATPVKDAFITELLQTLPPGLADRARVQFCGPGGTDAVEAAFKLVRAATGHTGMLAFTGAHHGMTDIALEASGLACDMRVMRLPYPQDYRCPFGVGGARGAELAAGWTESVLDGPESGFSPPAGMILEPVQGEGGVIPAPDDWMRRMREITAARSIPLIADEVQTGVGRTGAFWAVDHSGVTPDVMVLSKAIGGSLPLAVVVYRDDLDIGEPGTHTGTFRGNQLAMAAGTATLAHVRENGLAERAATLGSRMLTQLRELAREFSVIGDVRGRGLMIGVEFVDPEGGSEPVEGGAGAFGSGPVDVGAGASWSLGPAEGVGRHAAGPGLAPGPRPPAPELAAAVQRECLRRGLIVELGGRHASVVRLLPPLTITDEQAAAVLDRLADAVKAVAQRHARGDQTHQQRHRTSRHGARAERAG
ncbi:siderophore biosynthesis diaminobutyrate--2-oxoglutarate aminotransferase [Streptomyces sp. NL15-2K]|nr:aminotransferase class III-fold pyridoxal phosphate-dependent enzyme [Kutzneria buriramensis]WKX13155.1 aminotransferase class III-fold pyridoxal phosphate-dependent enzyme [Kutzneria buriramensis]GCB45509.1 siderophore biosynthesis diaminobutyrate--2-oxoglutarate aminotransferase [Streptomyces sp. NL15-2K]